VIDGSDVVLSADGVAKPVRVRYAYSWRPTCGLVNKQGLPASPFVTELGRDPAKKTGGESSED